MRYLLRNKDTGVVHEAQLGWTGSYMLTKCGISVPRGTGRWMKTKQAKQFDEQRISCRKCTGRG